MCCPDLRRWIFIFLILNSFSDFSHAQRIFLPPTTDPSPPVASLVAAESPPPPRNTENSLVLKTYPDGTKKIVPLEALNFRDDGSAFGGPPKLSIYQDTAKPPTALSPTSPERLTIASIGTSTGPSTLAANLPPSVDPLAGTTQVAAVDPMGGGAPNPMGGAPAANPMGGGGSAAPIDPLAGSAPKTAPPLQTVSGKPAPIVGDTTMLQLGEWESFFLNAGIGGALQGQLTARRVWNGTNRQAYPFGPVSNATFPYNGATSPGGSANPSGPSVSGENFTFNPGFRLDVEFGYNFYEWLGVGLQTGIVYNGINQYNVTFSDGSSYHNSADGELVQVPIQINGILRWPGQVKFRPFIGGGVGAVWQQLDINNYYFTTSDVQGNYCRSAFQFGWNAQVGVTYTVEPGLDFYGAFKVLSAFMPVIGNYQFGTTYNAAVEVGIQSRF
jgi:opacity protein-like surface antigen